MIDWQIIELNSSDSTNNYANALLSGNKAIDKTVIVAWCQTRGRGLGDNKWESEDFKNLTVSFIISPDQFPAENQFYLSRSVSLAVVDFFNQYNCQTSIKWPNDIYIGNEKIGGILIENIITGRNITSSVIGIGLNINQEKFISDAPNPISLKNITGNDVDLREALNILIRMLEKRLNQLNEKRYKEIKNEYISKMFWLNQWQTFESEEKIFTGNIQGTTDAGELIIKNQNGTEVCYLFGEVKFSL
jgi:BirA family transcriptional regulator, biotin operon repressor / biotin---[acetyl-CoA-carboxylase] ligase